MFVKSQCVMWCGPPPAFRSPSPEAGPEEDEESPLSSERRLLLSTLQQKVCVVITGLGPLPLPPLSLASFFKQVPWFLGTNLNFALQYVVFTFMYGRGDYRVLLQLNYHSINVRNCEISILYRNISEQNATLLIDCKLAEKVVFALNSISNDKCHMFLVILYL